MSECHNSIITPSRSTKTNTTTLQEHTTMVKPPKTMQPEHRQKQQPGAITTSSGEKPSSTSTRSSGSRRGFQPDSFHDYMARKIELQRKQFGLTVLPPPPPPPPKLQQQPLSRSSPRPTLHGDGINDQQRNDDDATASTSTTNTPTTSATTPRKVQFTNGTKQDDLESIRRSAEMRARAKSRRFGSSSSSSTSSPTYSSSKRLSDTSKKRRRISTPTPTSTSFSSSSFNSNSNNDTNVNYDRCSSRDRMDSGYEDGGWNGSDGDNQSNSEEESKGGDALTTSTTNRHNQSPSPAPKLSFESLPQSTSSTSTSVLSAHNVPKTGILKGISRSTTSRYNNPSNQPSSSSSSSQPSSRTQDDHHHHIDARNSSNRDLNRPSEPSNGEHAKQRIPHCCRNDDGDVDSATTQPTPHHRHVGNTVSDYDCVDPTSTNVNHHPLSLFPSPSLKRSRPDLFFLGVVVKTQGYTDPDDETLKRMLHAHGGDLEKYETSRITHLVAETLSTAKAGYLRQQRRPIPVVHPSWIVDSVHANKLLPYGPYLLQELSDGYHDAGKTKQVGIQSMFANQQQQQHQQQQIHLQNHTNNKQERGQEEDGQEPNTRRSQNDYNVLLMDTTKTAYDDTSTSTIHTSMNHSLLQNDDLLVSKMNNNAIAAASTSRSTSEEDDDDQTPSYAKCNEDPKSSHSSTNLLNAATNYKPATNGRTDERLINGKVRTVGTDPNFLESFFKNSRLSYIGSYRHRSVSASPSKKPRTTSATTTSSNNNQQKRSTSNRFVFHVDMDCFFAAVVLRNFPEYQNKPVVISHHGKKAQDNLGVGSSRGGVVDVPNDSTSECATCNYEARKYGIKKGMFLSRAKALCPDLVVLAYDFEGYEDVSRQVEEIIDSVASEHQGVVEVVSCDEAYIEIVFEDEGPFFSLYDRAFDVAETIRSKIFETTQCTASIGVAKNKFLAKLGGDKVKPNGSYVVREYRDILKDLRLRDLHGVGWRTEPKLADEGLFTVQDVWELGPSAESQLIRILGVASGKKIFGFCHGEDDRPVKSQTQKSIGAECNYGVRFDGPYGIDHFMLGLAKEVSKRMEGCGVTATKLTLKLKKRKENAGPPPKFLGHGSCYNLSKSTEIQTTRDVEIIRKIGMKLFRSFDVELDDVRGMGISMSGLTTMQDNRSNGSLRGAFEMQHWLRNGETSSGTDDLVFEHDELKSIDTDHAESIEKDAGVLSFDLPSTKGNCQREDSCIQVSHKKPHNNCPAQKDGSKKRKKNASSSSSSSGSCLHSKNRQKDRFLQTDLKRMMKLQAVQSGQEKSNVSLSVLDDLPLHLKLQVVNNDDQRLGSNSQRRLMSSATKQKSSSTRTGESFCHSQSLRERKSHWKDNNQRTDLVAAQRLGSNFSLLFDQEVSNVYEEDILPLRHFLDHHKTDTKMYNEEEQSAIDLVKIYIGTVVKERRFCDAISILRSIQKRCDHWSEPSVLNQIIEECSKVYGMDDNIGVDWLQS